MQTKLTRPSGLNKTQVKERLVRFGPNQLFVPAPVRFWAIAAEEI
jgi:hypothetical protein